VTNPTAATTTVTLTLAARSGPGRTTVGRVVAPGLAVVSDVNDGTRWPRFSLVHIRSGKMLCGPATSRCAAHIDEAVVIATGYGIDWEQTGTALAPLLSATTMHTWLRDQLGLCFDPWTCRARRCLGDRPPNQLKNRAIGAIG
jgi:hypothetical protein